MCWVSFRFEDLDDLRKHIHIDRNMIFYEERKSSCVECHSELTLLGLGGGAYMPPSGHVFAHMFANIVQARWKNLTSPNYKFGKGQFAFYPVKLSRFAEKNDVCQKHPNFLGGDSYVLGRRPLRPMKIYKSQSLSRGVLVIQTSWICLNKAKHS